MSIKQRLCATTVTLTLLGGGLLSGSGSAEAQQPKH